MVITQFDGNFGTSSLCAVLLGFCVGFQLVTIDAFVPGIKSSIWSSSVRPGLYAFSTDVMKPPPRPPGLDISESQKRAEEDARARHDLFAMNALFVNVKDHPDPTPCVVSKGLIPSDLPPGAVLRIGPNGAEKYEGWLDGDGLIHCVVIPEGKNSNPTFSSVYVQTRGRCLESAASSEQPKRFRGTLGVAPNGLPMLQNLLKNAVDFKTTIVQKDTCNTAMAYSGNRVLALMEQSPPSEVKISRDGRVDTVANMCRLDGAVKDAPITGGSFGAHGRTDPRTGQRVHVSYSSSEKPFVRVDTFADNWKLLSSVGVDVPAPVMVHDCAITDKYTIVLDFPLTVRPRRFLKNEFPVEYEPEHGARIGLVDRQADSTAGEKPRTQWFEVQAGVVLHVANAFERDDGTVVIHGFKSLPKGEGSYILDYTPAFLHQWILDPASGKVIDDTCLNPDELVEFPMVEDRYVGRNSGCIYGLQVTSIGGPIAECTTPQAGVLLDGVIKFSTNPESVGEVIDRYTLDSGWHFCAEPTVVTKTTGDGHYVLLIATYVPEGPYRDKKHDEMARDGHSVKSKMIVLDGDSIGLGPVSIVDLPYHVNYGLHSMFLPWEKMQ